MAGAVHHFMWFILGLTESYVMSQWREIPQIFLTFICIYLYN